jgi:hypothetical protein
MPFEQRSPSGRLQSMAEESAPVAEEAAEAEAPPAADELEAVLDALEAERKETREHVRKGQETLKRIANER